MSRPSYTKITLQTLSNCINLACICSLKDNGLFDFSGLEIEAKFWDEISWGVPKCGITNYCAEFLCFPSLFIFKTVNKLSEDSGWAA